PTWPGTSSGRCSTTSSGAGATRSGSASCSSTSAPRSGYRSRAPTSMPGSSAQERCHRSTATSSRSPRAGIRGKIVLFPSRRRPALTEFVFGFDLIDGHLDADDRAKLSFDELLRRIVDPPALSAARLIPFGQPGHYVTQPVSVGVEHQLAGEVHGCVVPRRHRPAVLLSALIPRRRNVGLWAMDDGQARKVGDSGAPLRIVQSYMP